MSAMPKSVHLLSSKKEVENAFERIFDKLENEASREDADFPKYRSSFPDHQMTGESALENRNPQPRYWIRCAIEQRYDTLRTAFGTIHVRSRMSKLRSRYFENKYQYEHEILFTICPAWWLVKIVFTYVLDLVSSVLRFRDENSHGTVFG